MSSGKTLVVVGGGAAGFFCAVNAARLDPSLDVILLEKTTKLLSKVKVSGGGRCNVTHACDSISSMIKNYPRGATFLKKTFGLHFIPDTIQWFESRNVPLKTEDDGRMFPVTNSSQTIIDCLLGEAAKYKVSVRTKASITQVKKTGEQFELLLEDGSTLYADKVCLSAGGFSTADKFNWFKELDHSIVPPVPSLFTFNMPGNKITSLMGITVPEVSVKIIGTKLFNTGPLLITHWGMSGPAVLKLSSLAARELADKNYHFKILVNWVPAFNENSMLEELRKIRQEKAAQKFVNKNPFALPSRLWEYLISTAGISEEMRYADVPAVAQNKLAKLLCNHEMDVKGKTTFKEEFVTAGGISLSEINPSTMESRKHENLYFAGELIDVDGVTGGFNFQNAWSTGMVAAMAISN